MENGFIRLVLRTKNESRGVPKEFTTAEVAKEFTSSNTTQGKQNMSKIQRLTLTLRLLKRMC